MADFKMNAADTNKTITLTLYEPSGAITDLTTATRVDILIRPEDGAAGKYTINAQATTNSPLNAADHVSYTIASLPGGGMYLVQAKVTWSGGRVDHVPTLQPKTLWVEPAL